jgi:anti-sigma factor RsiW
MNRGDDSIDELLNSYIDGELTQKQQMEVSRLITDDDQIARRLRDLQKCKMLVACLPHAQAPALGSVPAFAGTEDRRQRTEDSNPSSVLRRPVRRVLPVAAMIAIMAVVTAVIYSIFAPQDTADRSTPGTAAAAGFSGKLELTTSDLTAVDAFINRAIRDNELSDCVRTASLADRRVYSFSGGRDAVNLLLADLATIWERFGSATLMVETPKFSEQVVLGSVTAEQVAQIVKQEHQEKAIRMAKDFAVLNKMAELLPGKEMLAAAGEKKPSLITIPKPVLTGDGKTAKKPAPPGADTKEVELTIVVAAGK